MVQQSKKLIWAINGAVLVLLIICLWVPDADKALARTYLIDQFRNWDSFIMLPGWAYTHGMGLNTDILSSWGMGAVAFISRCAEALGGFDYVHVLQVLMGMVIIYYCFLYFFLKAWLRSDLIAFSMIAVAIKVQLFHTGVFPLIWVFPQDTPVRYWLDIPVFLCLWRHASRAQGKYLTWAAIGVGAALAWALSSGLCLLAAFWGYLSFLLIVPEFRSNLISNYKDLRQVFFYVLLPLVVLGLVLFLILGRGILNLGFWENCFEPIQLFLQGSGTVSIFYCLRERHFFAFIVEFVVPIIYAWNLLIIVNLAWSKKLHREDLFLVPLSLYGLAMYVHFLANGSTSHYYAVGLPLVMVLGFWFSKDIQALGRTLTLKVLALLAFLAWGALLTNTLFIYYPNIFNISGIDWKPEINFYRTQFTFDQDAAMIARLIGKEQQAALISSFEAELLMKADRKPFFYYSPLVVSQRRDINSFAGTSLITEQRIDKTIRQIQEERPEYIFIQKLLWGQWPADAAKDSPGIIAVLLYINGHYDFQYEGKDLIVMHRK